MKEHEPIYIEHRFILTDAFMKKHGIISEPEINDLCFYLMLERGRTIKSTGGFKKIRCKCGIADENVWDIVFADYNYPGKRKRAYLLVAKWPINIIEHMNRRQRRKLRILKDKLDGYMRDYFGQ
ncbi:MAG: hypothetical protein JW749_05775 [Sedimentisphaerales bacterium]|nr:hypothetical protein [Sedimentisphaerales bacterium]